MMLRERTLQLLELLTESEHRSIALVTHKGYLREVRRVTLCYAFACECEQPSRACDQLYDMAALRSLTTSPHGATRSQCAQLERGTLCRPDATECGNGEVRVYVVTISYEATPQGEQRRVAAELVHPASAA